MAESPPVRRRMALCRRADAEPGVPYDFIADADCAACQDALELMGQQRCRYPGRASQEQEGGT